ncbi:mechanosensitive ion channel domain-containing protein [Wenzhouxiangella sp. XN24]|uniref:mechanosensitive ion channel domain-containing protein n=1 Tax=Wenzhouxiangella sp. XN24 TaxID=2713569 RepID=UPI0013EABDF1|nr:mechanosensitive ion channel domain-containing protein [Wenzhouxiangella sp. XN24]NGX15039.1 mechanosensitive ion channel [Wenzhouxiangella sp. XN24]
MPPAKSSPRAAMLLLAVLCIACGLSAGAPAIAQVLPGISVPDRAETEEPAEETAPAPLRAVPLQAVPDRLDEGRELVRRAVNAARPDPEVESIAEQLTGLETRLETLDEPLPATDLRSLENALERVNGLRRDLTSLRLPLARRGSELGQRLESLQQASETWRLTREALAGGDAPAELLESVDNLQDALEDARQVVDGRLETILAMQAQLTRWRTPVEERREILEAAMAQAGAELFEPEHPAIWRSDISLGDLQGSRHAWQGDWQALQNYLAAREGALALHAGLLVLLLVFFFALARKVDQWVGDRPGLAPTLAIFRFPLAAALVMAILAGAWLYPDAPPVLRELFGVLLILPLLRMLPPIVSPVLRGPLYQVIALYALLRMDILLGTGTSLERYTLLLLTTAALAVAALMFRPGGPAAKLEAGPWWRAVRFAGRAGSLVLLTALLANIGGYVSLAGLLTNAVIGSAFAGIVLFAGVVVTRAALNAMLQTQLLRKSNLVRWHSAAIDGWVMRILPFVVLIGWIVATLRLFRLDGLLGQVVSGILFSRARIGTVSISLGDILGFALAIWLGLLLSRLLRFVLDVDVFPRVTLPRGVAATISMLVNYTILGIAVVFAVAAAGIQLDRFAIIVGALSVGIGFGLQNVVNNFVSGLILAFERPVQSGDTIEFTETFGNVTRIGVRSSTVRTFDGAEVIVPNANLISNEVTNWTLSDMRRRIEILAGVAYGTDPRKVIELLLAVARRNEKVLEDPEPAALFLGFGDSSLDFSLRAWTDDFNNYLTIKSDLTLAVHDALYESGIEIPFPQRDLHLRSVDSAAVARIGAVRSPEVGDAPASDAASSPDPGPGSRGGQGSGPSSGGTS